MTSPDLPSNEPQVGGVSSGPANPPEPPLPFPPAAQGWLGPSLFALFAMGLAWIFALPLFFTGGLTSPLFLPIALLTMCTPGLAAFLILRFFERAASPWRALGLWPLRPIGRLIGYLAIALLGMLLLTLVALPLGALFGVYPADFVGLSGFRALLTEQLAAQGITDDSLIDLVVVSQVINVFLAACINTVPALGEELGWRGYFFPRLLTLGPISAILISGIVWGLWHAPLLVLGYNYPGLPVWVALGMMVGMCTLFGALLGWLRIRSQSVWPAALGHGALNAGASLAVLFLAAGGTVNTLHATVLGWSGWIVPFLLVVVLLLARGFRAPHPGGEPLRKSQQTSPGVGAHPA